MADFTSLDQWSDVTNNDKFKDASSDVQEAIRGQFVNEVTGSNKSFQSADDNTKAQVTQQALAHTQDIDKQSGRTTVTNDLNQAESIGTGLYGAAAKAGAGLGQLGTYAIQGAGALAGSEDVQNAAKEARGQLSIVPANVEAKEAQSPNPELAKTADIGGTMAQYLAAPEVGVDAGLSKIVANSPQWVKGAVQGLGMTPGAAAITAGTEVSPEGTTGTEELKERGISAGEAALATTGAGAAAPVVAKAASTAYGWLSGLTKLGTGWVTGLLSKSAAEENATQSISKSMQKAYTGGDITPDTGQQLADQITTAQQKYRTPNAELSDSGQIIQPPTTALVPQMQDLASSQSKNVKNSVEAQSQEAQSTLGGYVQEKSTKPVEEAPVPEAANATNLKNTIGGENNLNATVNEYYDKQNTAQNKVPVDPKQIADTINATDFTGINPTDVQSAVTKLQSADNPLSSTMFKKLGINTIHVDPDTGAVNFIGSQGKYPVTLDQLSNATKVLNDVNKVPHQYGLDLNEQKVVSKLSDALNTAKDNVISAQTPELQATLTQGDKYFRNNALPLRQQDIPFNRDFDFTETKPTGQSKTTYTGQPSNEQSINYQAKQASLEGSKTDIPFDGSDGGKNAQDLLKQNPNHAQGIATRIQADIQADPKFNGINDVLSDPNGYESTMTQLAKTNPEVHDQVVNWVKQQSINKLTSVDGPMYKGGQTISEDFITKATTPGTDEYNAIDRLYSGKGGTQPVSKMSNGELPDSVEAENTAVNGNALDIRNSLAIGKELLYNKPLNDMEPNRTEQAVKGIGSVLGFRLLTLSEASRAVKEFTNKTYGPLMDRVLTDPEFAKEVSTAYTKKDYGAMAKYLTDSELDKTVGAALNANDNSNNDIDANVSGATGGR